MPRVFDGSMSLGAIMQVASAFTIVQHALSWFMENYTRLADWTASARRVGALILAIDDLEAVECGGAASIAHREEGQAALQLTDVVVARDDGTAIVRGASVRIDSGE